jgi:hypothetical protein
VRTDTIRAMPIVYRIDKSLALMTTVWDGPISASDWREHLRETFAEPDWPGVLRNLTDLRSADLSAITDADRVEMVAMYEPHAEHIRGKKSAVVAGDNFERSREFESHNEPPGLRVIVFNDLFNACTWLGIDISEANETFDELRREARDPESRCSDPGSPAAGS